MNKTNYVSYLKGALKSEVSTLTIVKLQEELDQLGQKDDKVSLSEFANSIESELPQFEVIKDYFVRAKLTKIESHIRTIKTIVVIWAILTAIGVLIMVVSTLGVIS